MEVPIRVQTSSIVHLKVQLAIYAQFIWNRSFSPLALHSSHHDKNIRVKFHVYTNISVDPIDLYHQKHIIRYQTCLVVIHFVVVIRTDVECFRLFSFFFMMFALSKICQSVNTFYPILLCILFVRLIKYSTNTRLEYEPIIDLLNNKHFFMCGKMVHELCGLYLQTNSYIWMSSVVYFFSDGTALQMNWAFYIIKYNLLIKYFHTKWKLIFFLFKKLLFFNNNQIWIEKNEKTPRAVIWIVQTIDVLTTQMQLKKPANSHSAIAWGLNAAAVILHGIRYDMKSEACKWLSVKFECECESSAMKAIKEWGVSGALKKWRNKQ